MSWFSLVIGQNASRQLATSSENLVASAQFLVALATSESQFRALPLVLKEDLRSSYHIASPLCDVTSVLIILCHE